MEPLTQRGRIALNPADRQGDPRHAPSGKVQLKFDDLPHRELEVELLDISAPHRVETGFVTVR